MTRPRYSTNVAHKQSGAALVVALILLVALTLLALASMNSASLDLVMVGNEQYRAQAFAAAEAGIEQADISDTNFDTSKTVTGSGSTATGVSYSYSVAPFNNGQVYSATNGNSVGTYQSIYFTITSIGSGIRSATATHEQGEKITVKTADTGPTSDDTLDTNVEDFSVTS